MQLSALRPVNLPLGSQWNIILAWQLVLDRFLVWAVFIFVKGHMLICKSISLFSHCKLDGSFFFPLIYHSGETIDSCIPKSLKSAFITCGHVERPFCKLQILAKSQLAAAVCHSTLRTPETGLHIKSCSTSASLLDLLHVFNWDLLAAWWPVCRGMFRPVMVRKMSALSSNHPPHPYELWKITWKQWMSFFTTRPCWKQPEKEQLLRFRTTAGQWFSNEEGFELFIETDPFPVFQLRHGRSLKLSEMRMIWWAVLAC